MRQVICLGILILAVGILLSETAQGQDYNLPPGARVGDAPTRDYHGTGRATFTALKIGQSARASGMGEAYTAVSDDINAIFWNPAGLTHIERFEYAMGYTRWLLKDMKFFSGAMAWRYGQQTIGLSLIHFDAGTSPETTPLRPAGTGRNLYAGNIILKACLARKMTNKLSVGVSVKWIQETLDKDKLNSASFDFSTIFYTGLGSSRIAMTLNNFGKDQELQTPGSLSEGTSVAQPLVYTIAGAMEAIGRKGDPYSLTVAGELAYLIDDRERFQVGGELWAQNTLALRAGYRWRYDLGDWMVGAGVQRKMAAGRRIGVDFSYMNVKKVFSAPLQVSLTGAF